jgi:hypothetical protein
MPSPGFESGTSRNSASKSESEFIDCDPKTCRNAKFPSGFIDSEPEISRDAKSKFCV